MQKFCLNNIKSFKQSEEIEMKPITVFVGNISGRHPYTFVAFWQFD